MNQELFQEYEKFLNHDQKRLTKIKRQIRQLALLRFFAFVAIILSLIYLPRISSWLAYSIATGCTILFFFWIKKFIKKEKEKLLFTNLVEINQKELIALGEEYGQFEDGNEFIDPQHRFTFDLDIFGKGSLFQFINRTVTQLGRKQLSSFLSTHETDLTKLEKRTQALLELAKQTRWRQLFSAKGHTKDEQDLVLLEKITSKVEIKNTTRLRRLTLILPTISLSFVLICWLTNLPWILLLFTLMINGFVLWANRKTTQSFFDLFGSQSNLLANYKELLTLIEEERFEATLLIDLKKQLFTNDQTASKTLSQLQKIMAQFDYGKNMLLGPIFNAFLLWDLKCCLQLFQWQTENANSFNHWFETIAEFDALSSLANLNHNHPEWTLPKFEAGEFHLTTNDLKHPLIKSAKCIGNDFRLNGDGQIAIVTGANMAGKSTFLRTIGVNMILAMNGCRVNASWFSMKPLQLFTNMRTTDNLKNDESYFFAELQRLKAILDELRAGNQTFVIIDEMLKGTNSEDKLSGSIRLIQQLISLQAVGLVATHDLKLTELAEKYPHNISNQCFEIQLNEDELIFDYKLAAGVTTTMNANFLMKKMGIIPEN